MAKKNQSGKGASKVEASGKDEKPQPQTVPPVPQMLAELDESQLLEALKLKRQEKRDSILAQMEPHQTALAALQAQLRELDAQDGIRQRRTNGGSINTKGANATAILQALKSGPMTVKAMKELPSIAAIMVGKYEKSFMAVNLAALRDKGLVQQTAIRGEWKLTAEGEKAADENGNGSHSEAA